MMPVAEMARYVFNDLLLRMMRANRRGDKETADRLMGAALALDDAYLLTDETITSEE